jgi:hypothetical protein
MPLLVGCLLLQRQHHLTAADFRFLRRPNGLVLLLAAAAAAGSAVHSKNQIGKLEQKF